MPQITVKLHIVDYSRQCMPTFPQWIATKFAHRVDGSELKTKFPKKNFCHS